MLKKLIEWLRDDYDVIATATLTGNINWYDDEYQFTTKEYAIYTFYIGRKTGHRRCTVMSSKNYFSIESTVQDEHAIMIWKKTGKLPNWAIPMEKKPELKIVNF